MNCKIEFVKTGRVLECPDTKTVLEAAQEAGIDIPFSCQGGTCHTCALKVEGDIETEEMLALSAQEMAEGWRLVCVGKPKGDLKVYA